MHDGWQSYWRYACEHGLCNVHMLRELIFLFEHLQQVWIEQMQALLLDMSKHDVEQARAAGPLLEIRGKALSPFRFEVRQKEDRCSTLNS